MATEQYINHGCLDAYKAGWPTPASYPIGQEREIYDKQMKQIVAWGLDEEKMHLVKAVGPVAKKNPYEAMYLLGLVDEPPGTTDVERTLALA